MIIHGLKISTISGNALLHWTVDVLATLWCVQSGTILQSSEIPYSQTGAQNIRIFSIRQSASCKRRLQLSNDLFGEPSALVGLQKPHQFAYEILLELETIHLAFTASDIFPKVFQKWLQDYLAHLRRCQNPFSAEATKLSCFSNSITATNYSSSDSLQR